ncbi:MAG TPA: hypothetical protein PKD26_05475 [Pyrinomonadaceae bacterium]|nr:hypothetical protein [Pyrinomonadaceae bacterium]
MALRFTAVLEPARSLYEQIAALSPENPFVTYDFSLVRTELGSVPLAFTLDEAGQIVSGCLAFLTRGRLNTRLEIISLPRITDKDVFWEGVFSYCRENSITSLDIETFASVFSDLPNSPGPVLSHERVEFRIDLTALDLWSLLNRRHRRMVTRAREAGLILRKCTGPEAIAAHVDLANLSLNRLRQRGERVDSVIRGREVELSLQHGVGDLYQAFRNDELMGTLFAAKSRTGAYAQSSGSSDGGRELGASHFLFFEVARCLKDEKKEVFNIGGVEARTSGLAEFKRGFGAKEIKLQAAEYYLGGPLRRMVTNAKAILVGS